MKAVVFDMDGVLFDTERLSISCWMETAQKMGLGDIREGAYGCIGLNRTDSRIFIKGLYGESFPYDEFRAQNSALFQEKPVGCVSVDQSGNGNYLFGLCIDPEVQHQGFGRCMLFEVLKQLRASDDREITLGVDRENLAALPLYQSCGFKERTETQYYEMSL